MQPTSLVCNGELIRFFRGEKHLTQAELAEHCDCTERLIRKAEQDGQCSVSSIRTIAAALSTDGRQLSVEDLTSYPLEMAQRYTQALYTCQEKLVDSLSDMLDPDVLFRVNGDPAVIPFAGDYRGTSEVREGFRRFFSVMQVPEEEDFSKTHQYFTRGLEVHMWGDSWIHPRGMQLESPMKLSNYFRFRNGKLVWFEDQFDISRAEHLLRSSSPTSTESNPE